MNLDDDDGDSVFEQALRADLPSRSEQSRLRQRILAAGVAAGTALGSSNVAAAAQASFGASALSKLSALSWPAKLGVAAVLVSPVAALPLVSAPVQGAAIVSQVRSSVATVRAGAASKATRSSVPALPLETPQASQQTTRTEPPPEPARAIVAPRMPAATASNGQTSLAPSANPRSNAPLNGNASAAVSAVAAFDSPPQVTSPPQVASLAPVASSAQGAPASESDRLRNESTLAAETHLLDRAFAALAANDRRTAAALVAEHARRFPNGLLRQERERARTRLEQEPKGE